MIIESGGKTSNKMIVDSDGHGHVRAFTQDVAHLQSDELGKSFTWAIVPYNYAALDTILLLRNDDPENQLVVTDIWMTSDAATDFILHYTDGVAFVPAGTAVLAQNSNRKKVGTAALATAMATETNNAQGNITIQLPLAANVPVHIDTKAAVILGYHNSIAIDFPTVGTMAWAVMGGYFQEPHE